MQQTSLQAALDETIRNLEQRARPVRIVYKRSFLHQRLIDRALRLLTLGGQRNYLSQYVTTLGHTIYVPDDWSSWAPARACEVLRHELVHVKQFERFGVLGMVLLYGLLPLPFGFAYGRARLEWEAYAETLRAIAELEGIEAASSEDLHREIIRRFTGPDYAWMWPFPKTVGRWIHEELTRIRSVVPLKPTR